MANIWCDFPSPTDIYHLIFRNNRAIANDKNIYEKPEIFNPDRYFDNDGKLTMEGIHPEVWSFGFGRRCVEFGIGIILFLLFYCTMSSICPGRQLALDTVRQAQSAHR